MRNITVLTAFSSAFVLALGQAQPSPQKSQTAHATDEQIQAELSKTAAATTAWEKSTTPGIKAEVQLQARGKPVM